MQDILKNKNRKPGYQAIMYVILHEDIDVFPAPTAGSYEIATAITPVTGKGFIEIPVSVVPGKSNYASESQGDDDNPSRNGTLTAFYPGYDAVTAYELDQLEGQEVVILIGQKKNCNEAGNAIHQVIGDKCAGASFKSVYADGDATKGFTITATEFAASNPMVYTAAVPV